MLPLNGRIVVVALLALYLGRTETERDTADAVQVAAWRVADNRGLAVVPDLGCDFPAGRAKPGRSAPGRRGCNTQAAASHDLAICSHLGRALLRQ
jgi:hypothetical protein